jgi:lipopolysaccharide transport protein LptA
MDMDQAKNIGVFTGNVRVVGTGIKMTCKKMEVTFSRPPDSKPDKILATGSPPPDSKPDKILATGDVDILEDKRRTKAGKADYNLVTKTIILTERPEIVEPKTTIRGNTIKIDRTTNIVEVQNSSLVMQDSLDVAPKDAPPALPGAAPADNIPTTITSDSMHMDQTKNIGTFYGNVKVVTKGIKMSCKEMHVSYSAPPGSKPEKILAIGDVDIYETARRTQAGQADYNLITKIIILTERPEIVEPKTTVRGSAIRIDRNRDTVEVEVSTLVLQDGIDAEPSKGPTATPTPPGALPR